MTKLNLVTSEGKAITSITSADDIKRRLSALASNGVYVDYYPHNSRLDSRVQAFVSSTVRSDP